MINRIQNMCDVIFAILHTPSHRNACTNVYMKESKLDN